MLAHPIPSFANLAEDLIVQKVPLTYPLMVFVPQQIFPLSLCVCILLLNGCGRKEAPQSDVDLPTEVPPVEVSSPLESDRNNLDAFLAEAEDVEFVEHEVVVDDETFILLAPKDVTVEAPGNDNRIVVTFAPDAAIRFRIGKFDKQRQMDREQLISDEIRTFAFVDDEALVVERTGDNENRFVGYIAATPGLYELVASTFSPARYRDGVTLPRCQQMLKCGRTLRLKEPLPDDTFALLKRLKYRYGPKTDDPMEITTVYPPQSCTPAQLSLITRLPNIESLTLHGIGHAADFMEHVGGCTKLKRLEVRNLPLDDESMRHLGNCVDLEWFLGEMPYEITQEGFAVFKKLPHLKEVTLGRVRDDRIGGLATLATATGLESLTLSIVAENDSALQIGSQFDFLGKLPELKKLEINSLSPYLSDASLSFCSKLSQLNELDLSYYAGGDEGLSHLTNMASLRELQLECSSSNTISPAGMAHLAAIPNLENLRFTEVSLTDAHLTPLVNSNVRSITLNNCEKITLEGFLQLKDMPNLTWMKLIDAQVTDDELKSLREALPDVRVVP